MTVVTCGVCRILLQVYVVIFSFLHQCESKSHNIVAFMLIKYDAVGVCLDYMIKSGCEGLIIGHKLCADYKYTALVIHSFEDTPDPELFEIPQIKRFQ